VVLLCLLFGRGYSWEAVSALAVVCLVQACCGMCFGLMVTSLCSNRDQVIQVGIGSVLPTFVLAGVIWPREGMPHALNILSQALPVPLSCDLARSLMTTTTIDDVPLEKMGFGICVPILWSVAFLVICNYRIRRWGLLG
jgi:ABC-2 type transport system permease protein